jgi:hypothetical protein
VKRGNSSACANVNCNVCGNNDSAVLPVVPNAVYNVSINPVIQSKTGLVNHATIYPARDNEDFEWLG